LSIGGVFDGALVGAGVVPWSGVVRSLGGWVVGRANEDAEAELLVVLGGDVGSFAVVSDDASDAGDDGGRFLERGTRCTFVCVV